MVTSITLENLITINLIKIEFRDKSNRDSRLLQTKKKNSFGDHCIPS